MPEEYNSIKTFSDLISKVGIEIPLIQRDYVQGRIHDYSNLQGKGDETSKALLKKYISERERRDNFINQLIDALEHPGSASMQLTFIYGTIESKSANSLHHEESLVPLDGQQRLTTLFLLTWLLIHLQSTEDLNEIESKPEYAKLKKGMRSFSYKTRPSSGAFCSALLNEEMRKIEGTISEVLKAQSWFGDEWNLDPSVQAMLQMLDGMESILCDKDVKIMLENLVAGKGIEFELLDMQDYKLTDGLYIKMNARGKQLTEFENWKSEFIGFLEECHKTDYYNGNIDAAVLQNVFGGQRPTLSEYFAYSIEHQWTDLFWNYCKEEIEQHNQDVNNHPEMSKREKDCYPVIDTYFMNVFEKLTQILFFEKNPTKKDAADYKPSKETRNELYGDEQNVQNLFAYLDVLCKFDNSFFNSIFYIADNQNTLQGCKVRLFDAKNSNLLTRCAKNIDSYDATNTLLYALLKYAKEFGTSVDADMKNYTRLVRNSIESKQFLSSKDVSMTYDFRINDFCSKNVAQYIDSLIAQKKNGTLKGFSNEKAAIEDLNFICGNKDISISGISDATIYEVLKAWDSMSLIEKQQLLIAYGYRGHYVMTCGHGNLYFFGADNRWKALFVHNDARTVQSFDLAIGSIITDYCNLLGVSGSAALSQLLNNKKKALAAFDFQYYALKYSAFLNACAHSKNPSYYFSVKGNIDELDLIASVYSSKPTLAFHTDPIVYVLKEELLGKNINTATQTLYLGYSVTGANRADLLVYDAKWGDESSLQARFHHKSGIHGNGGWEQLQIGTNTVISSSKDTKGMDRIQAGLNLVLSVFPNAKFEERG